MDADLDTLATALYVSTDDLLKAHPERVPARPAVGIAPQISDAELVTLAVMQALLGYTSETRWLRYARAHLRRCSRTCRSSPATTSGCASWPRRWLADRRSWAADQRRRPTTCGWSTPPRSSAPAPARPCKRSDLAGWAEYGYCASHSRYFWGLRLHLVCTLHGLPVGLRADRRQGRRTRGPRSTSCAATPALATARDRRQIVIADKNYYGREFEARLADAGIDLLRPARKGEKPRRRATVLQTAAPDHRVGQRHLQRPTRPRTPRRTAPPPASAPASRNASSP